VIVFSNTTPFIALASIGRLDLLPQLFGKVHVAQSVIDECAEGGRILVPDLRSLEIELTPSGSVLDRIYRAEKRGWVIAIIGAVVVPGWNGG